MQGHTGLDVDQGDVVGEHVVQLAGDAHALLPGPSPGLLGPLPLGRLATLPPGHDHLRGHQHQQQPAQVGGGGGRRRRLHPVEQGRQGEVAGQADEGDHPGGPPGAAGDRRPEGDDQRQPGRPIGIAEGEIEHIGGHHGDQHPDRGTPAEQQRHRPGGQQRIGEQVQRLAARLAPGRQGGQPELDDADGHRDGHVGRPARREHAQQVPLRTGGRVAGGTHGATVGHRGRRRHRPPGASRLPRRE
jgi:hypothetical protein